MSKIDEIEEHIHAELPAPHEPWCERLHADLDALIAIARAAEEVVRTRNAWNETPRSAEHVDSDDCVACEEDRALDAAFESAFDRLSKVIND